MDNMEYDFDSWMDSSDDSMGFSISAITSPLRAHEIPDPIFTNENARHSLDDDEEMDSMISLFNDEWSCDSGVASSFSNSVTWTSNSFSMSSKESTSRIATILESSTENLTVDLSDQEGDTVISLKDLEYSKVEINESPKPQRLCLQDVTHRKNLGPTKMTPKKNSPSVKTQKPNNRKRPCSAFTFKTLITSPAKIQDTKRRSEFLREKRKSSQGIPAGAQPIRRIQSTGVLESSFNSSLSPEVVEHYSLRTVDKPQIEDTAFRSIDANTLAALVNSLTVEQFEEKFVLVDCRYPFEYDGGHVKNSINVFDPELIVSMFYPSSKEQFDKMKTKIPIFYCEFSQKRGPQMARRLRKCDREHNQVNYPRLDYPEIYVLDHGYRKFFNNDKLHHLCEPRHYVPMLQPAFSSQLKMYHQHKRKGTQR
ncbi:M-phase inducer phosphatase [Aphelenchoides besseyi]|nr:M-phase inducer phosphatase [Aphelenchoides besseyi]KAI6199638.1 M-phase inducer phosphatase [Aphelenchoides besseyi]